MCKVPQRKDTAQWQKSLTNIWQYIMKGKGCLHWDSVKGNGVSVPDRKRKRERNRGSRCGPWQSRAVCHKGLRQHPRPCFSLLLSPPKWQSIIWLPAAQHLSVTAHSLSPLSSHTSNQRSQPLNLSAIPPSSTLAIKTKAQLDLISPTGTPSPIVCSGHY